MTVFRIACLVLICLACGLGGFVGGALFEHLRKGGTADLRVRLRTVTRLRPVPSTELQRRLAGERRA